MEIRAAHEADLPALPLIELSAAQKFVGRDIPPELLNDVTPAAAYRPHFDAGLLWVIDDAGDAVAFLAARIAGDRLHIDELDVRQDRQGHGLGRRLLDHARAVAGSRGLARLSLTTFRNIPWNAPYYARFGFRDWPAAEADPDVRAALANETSRGLKDRCAMVMDL